MKNDFVGKIFGRLTVLSHEGTDGNNSIYECACECGNIINAKRPNLRTGKTKSCGCLNSELASERRYLHGMSKTRLHNIWLGMINRCYSPKSTSYPRYGGVGISICTEWEDFIPFMKWATENGYKDNLSIDRVDGSGNYEPSNCRWATHKEQAINRKPSHLWNYSKDNKNNSSGIKGVAFDKNRNKWVAQINFKITGHKQKRFKTREEAVSQREKWERLKFEAGILQIRNKYDTEND